MKTEIAKFSIESLNEDQRNAYEKLVNSSDNFFVTGKAGTGKSYLLNTLVNHIGKNYAIVAPTGIAAIQVGGQTIHSFFSLSPTIQAAYDMNEVHNGLSEKRIAILKNLDLLIIDEISMVRVDLMDMIDAKLKAARGNDRPFGGCRVIAFGDLYQLPPVVEDDIDILKFFSDRYGTVFFFGAPVLSKNPFKIIELTQIERQKEDDGFKELLNAIREGEYSSDLLDKLNTRCVDCPKDVECITLVTTNSAADSINNQHLSELSSEEHIYHGEVEGNYDLEDLPTNMILRLKEGAQIMMLRNNPGKWVNGSIGKIVSLDSDIIKVKIKGSGVFSVDKETWTKYEYIYDEKKKHIEKKDVGYFKQYPIKIAYAITIHKSQGQTLDCAEVDYSSMHAFAAGQTYVALSRCESFSKLYLTVPLTVEDIKVSQEIIDFMKGTFISNNCDDIKIPLVDKKAIQTNIKWRDDRRIEATDNKKHKKITGTRLPKVLDLIPKYSPFVMWCAMMHVYEEPFKETKWTHAGEVIEPKQFEYVKKVLSDKGNTFVSPTDKYGEGFKEKNGCDFFGCFERFGGMWDYLLERNGKTTMVFEMKTTGIRNKFQWESQIPKEYVLQAALYAWMLGVDQLCMVCSFLEEKDYATPEKYECNKFNTIIRQMKISEALPDFEKKYIIPAMEWWDKFIETGISPKYDETRDKDVLEKIRQMM